MNPEAVKWITLELVFLAAAGAAGESATGRCWPRSGFGFTGEVEAFSAAFSAAFPSRLKDRSCGKLLEVSSSIAGAESAVVVVGPVGLFG